MKEKKYFTEQQTELLKEAEIHFYTAINANYKRATTARLNDYIADVYEATTGDKIQRNWQCGTCVLNCYKTVGALYFESKEYWEHQKTNDPQLEFDFPETEVNNTEVVLEPEPKVPSEPSEKKVANNKRGRKSKK